MNVCKKCGYTLIPNYKTSDGILVCPDCGYPVNIETLDDYCKKIKCPHYKEGKDCGIDNCEIRDGEMDDNYYRGD